MNTKQLKTLDKFINESSSKTRAKKAEKLALKFFPKTVEKLKTS